MRTAVQALYLRLFSSTLTLHPPWFSKYLSHQPTVACFETEDTCINYRHWSNTNKPGLLFVHGHAAHARWWDFIAPAFRDSHNVAAIDLSGSGDSHHRSTYSARLFAREIIGCIETTGMHTATVVGHSFGGTITRTAAYLYPNQISAIILVDSSIPTREKLHRPPPKPRGKKRYYQSVPEAIKRFRLRPPQPRPKDFIFNYVAEHSLKKTEKGYCFKYDSAIFSKMLAAENFPVATDMIINMTLPVGLIYGKLSRFFPPAIVETLSTLVPPELSFGIPQAHHHVFLDQPVKFIENLKSLLSILSKEQHLSH